MAPHLQCHHSRNCIIRRPLGPAPSRFPWLPHHLPAFVLSFLSAFLPPHHAYPGVPRLAPPLFLAQVSLTMGSGGEAWEGGRCGGGHQRAVWEEERVHFVAPTLLLQRSKNIPAFSSGGAPFVVPGKVPTISPTPTPPTPPPRPPPCPPPHLLPPPPPSPTLRCSHTSLVPPHLPLHPAHLPGPPPTPPKVRKEA